MSAEVTLGWNNAKLAAGARQASAIVDSTTAKMRSAFTGLAAAGGAFLGVREIVDATVKYDSLRLGMVSLTGSVEAATDRMSELRTLAKDPGLGFAQVVETDIRLRSAGISASVSERAIREFGNALAVVGKGKEELDGVALALSQIASKGKVSAEEINQIAERVPQIRTVMKDVFGTADTEEIQKMGIPVESFITLIVDGFSRTIPRAIVGLQGKWDNFTDAITGSLADFGKGMSEEVIGPIEKLTDVLDKNSSSFTYAGEAIGEMITGFGELGKVAGGAAASIGKDYLSVQLATFQAVFGGIPAVKSLTDEVEQYSKSSKAGLDIAKTVIEYTERQAAAEERLAKEKANLNAHLDVYIAKQSRANAEMEQAAVAARKQTEELKKLELALAAAQERTSSAFASPKNQQRAEVAKLEKVEAQIDVAEFAGDKAKVLQLETEREGILLRIGQLEKQIKADTESQIEDNERLAKAKVEAMLAATQHAAEQEKAMQLFALELAIAEAASRGQDAKVAKLERERDIIETTVRLMNELGVSYAEAVRLAERLVNAEKSAEDRKKGSDGERSKIFGYSRERQGDAASAQLRATEARDFKTRQANTRFEVGTGLEGGRFDAFSEGQRARFGQAFGNAPAAEQAIKQPDSGLSQIMAALDKWAASTTETFERAFQ